MKNPSKKPLTDAIPKSRAKSKPKVEPDEIEVVYREAADLKTHYISGTIPSITVEGLIQLSCYTERRPMPRKAVITIDADETSEEDEYDSVEVVRELNFSFLLSPQAAAQFIDALKFGIGLVRGRASKKIERNENPAQD